MKKLSLSIVATVAILGSANANTLQEALSGGKISGEFAVTYENKNSDAAEDSAYSVGSFAIGYETGVWNNLSITAKARAYRAIYEENDGDVLKSNEFNTQEGKNAQVFETLYIKYASEHFTAIGGRQFLSSDWLEHTQDAISLYGIWNNTYIEAVHSLKVGKITAREFDERADITDLNGNDGVYKLGVTQKLNDNISATVYYLTYPNDHDKYGGRINLEFGAFNFMAHYNGITLDNNRKNQTGFEDDGGLVQLTASYSIAGWTPYVGFVQVKDDGGSTNSVAYASEEIINVMEEGDGFFLPDAQTIYAGVSKAFGPLSANLLLGTSKWNGGVNGEQDYMESTLWLGYKITEELAFNTGLTTISGSNDGTIADKDQINLTLVYSF